MYSLYLRAFFKMYSQSNRIELKRMNSSYCCCHFFTLEITLAAVLRVDVNLTELDMLLLTSPACWLNAAMFAFKPSMRFVKFVLRSSVSHKARLVEKIQKSPTS